MKWDEYFIELAYVVAKKSKDPSTKCGSVIVRQDHSIVSTGYNGFPRGCNDDEKYYNDREEKYERIIHSEPNAIIQAAERLNGYTLYVVPMPPCNRCANLIIQSGIKRIVCPKANPEKLERWAEAFDRAKSMYVRAGVEFIEIQPKFQSGGLVNVPIKFNKLNAS